MAVLVHVIQPQDIRDRSRWSTVESNIDRVRQSAGAGGIIDQGPSLWPHFRPTIIYYLLVHITQLLAISCFREWVVNSDIPRSNPIVTDRIQGSRGSMSNTWGNCRLITSDPSKCWCSGTVSVGPTLGPLLDLSNCQHLRSLSFFDLHPLRLCSSRPSPIDTHRLTEILPHLIPPAISAGSLNPQNHLFSFGNCYPANRPTLLQSRRHDTQPDTTSHLQNLLDRRHNTTQNV